MDGPNITASTHRSPYGSVEMLGWLVDECGIEPHMTVFDKSARKDSTFSRHDFNYDHGYFCLAGKTPTTTGVNHNTTMLYRASKNHCTGCALKPRCCLNTLAWKVPRSIHEGRWYMARQIDERARLNISIALDQNLLAKLYDYFLMEKVADWKPIATAPVDADLELSIYEDGEYHALVFPCRRDAQGGVM